jgi:hypothetical protein
MIVMSVAVASSLAACKKKQSECPEAGKHAAEAVAEAFFEAKLEGDRLKAAEEVARTEAPRLEKAEQDLEARIKLFEQSMDCLVKADCCAHLGKLDLHARAAVQSTGLDILASEKQPEELQAVLQPLAALMNKASFLGEGRPDPKEATAWCTSMREAMANVRRESPAVWKRAVADANKKVADAHALVVAQDKQVARLNEWMDALTKSKAAPIPAELDGSGPALKAAREAVAKYQKCR